MLWIVAGGGSKNRGLVDVFLSPHPTLTNPLPPEEAPPNGVKCHYCSGSKLAPCDSLSIMSCTGHQTVCVTLKGTWRQGKGSLQEVIAWRAFLFPALGSICMRVLVTYC